MKKVAFIHTVHAVIPQMDKLFHDIIKNAEVFHLLDESILKKAIAQGRLTPDLCAKIAALARMAEAGGADVIMVTCSSVSPCVDVAQKRVRVPVLKIDQPMAEEAGRHGGRVAVVATLKATLNPTSALIRTNAAKCKSDLRIVPFLCAHAFKALVRGDLKAHDEQICEKLLLADREADLIVLAQASMANVIQRTNVKLTRKVLTSPVSGIRNILKYL